MQRDLDRLAREEFDLLVIGGGISGAAVAHDAALRGLSVALVEKRDFGAATSAASSKLIHGGIRYLQQGRLDKVRESARERAAFQTIAPHLTRYVPFLIPADRTWRGGGVALSAGVGLYEWLTAGANRRIPDPAKRVPAGRRVGADEIRRLIPALAASPGVTGGHVVFESHMHSAERMTLAFVRSAAAGGAAVANYVAAESLLKAGTAVRGVVARDVLTGRELRIDARLTANVAGPWITEVDGWTDDGRAGPRVTGFSKGTHIVTRILVPDFAVALPTRRKAAAVVTRGGRHVFVIPWRGRSLIGTTDSPFQGRIDDVQPTASDIDELIGDVNAALPGTDLERGDVEHAFAGLYPLTDAVLRDDVYQGSGDYQLVDHAARGGPTGFISVLGAKFTTARRLAERTVDLAVRKLGRRAVPSATATTPLVGGAIPDLGAFRADVGRRFTGLDGSQLDHLVAGYGTEVEAVLAAAPGPGGTARLAPDRETLEAEVAYAVDLEMAMSLEDVVMRRTGLGTIGHPGTDCLRRSAGIIGARHGWTAERMDDEVRRIEHLFGAASPGWRQRRGGRSS